MALPVQEWYFQLVNRWTGKAIDDDAAQMLVLTAGAPTAPTVYSDANGTSVSNAYRTPRTASNGVFRFWTDPATTSVDLSVMTSNGEAYFLQDVVPSDHKIYVDPHQQNYMLTIPVQDSSAAEVDSGMDFPVANLLVMDAILRVTTIDATETVDVGILSSESGGDADGFLALASVGTAGYVDVAPIVTEGATIDFVSSSEYGVLLQNFLTGSDAASENGGYVRKYYRTDGVAKSVSWTETTGGDTLRGYVSFPYIKLP
jgi:hypothetical protein